jgi:hypothetical protein|nr:hypothetical protein [Rhodoplanes serenus]
MTIAQNRCTRADHRFDSAESTFCTTLLNEADEGIDDNDTRDDACIYSVAEQSSYGGGDQQDVDQKIVELRYEPRNDAAWLRSRQPVKSMPFQTLLGFQNGKAARSALQSIDSIGADCMPLRRSPRLGGRRRARYCTIHDCCFTASA